MTTEQETSITKTDKPRPLKGPEVSRTLYGGVLDFDAAGHYPGLELLNLVFSNAGDEILPQGDELLFVRRSMDFARRLVWSENFLADPKRQEVLLGDEEAEESLRALLRCLQLEIPSGATEPKWSRAHFFPYTPSLIHWDARERYSSIRLERLYLRGGGALAFSILRSDPRAERLLRIREGFRNLYSTASESPLETLAHFLRDQSMADAAPVPDDIEGRSSARQDASEDLYRDGVANILDHSEVTSATQIRALMGWTGLWLVLMQSQRSHDALNLQPPALICDCGAGSPQLRRASQRCLQDIQNTIVNAVREVEPRLVATQRNKIRSFFWATAAANGVLNAWRGRKHFTLSADALELVVLATIPAGKEVPFEEFVTGILYDKLGLAVGRGAAEKSRLINSIDASIFEENEAQLAMQMIASGLATQYSDATRMVGPRKSS